VEESSSKIGDWNGHLFSLEGKKCLIFMNNKTCYTLLMTIIYKKHVKALANVFKERLIHQLDHDVKITESQETKIRVEAANIVFAPSNNDKKIAGTINSFVEAIKFKCAADGGLEHWHDVTENAILNTSLVGTKIHTNVRRTRDYFTPDNAMKELISIVL
jgi:hypothetical protein